jgi:hypothetical protein
MTSPPNHAPTDEQTTVAEITPIRTTPPRAPGAMANLSHEELTTPTGAKKPTRERVAIR